MSTRERLLDAAVAVIRRQGLHATTVEQLCEHAGVTKGGFFHHVASKEAIAVAATEHWGSATGAMFADHRYHGADTPVGRIMGYLDLRAAMISDDPAEFSCLAGTIVQEAFATVLQGSFIRAKAAADPQLVLEGLDHRRRYLSCLLVPQQGAHS